MINIGPCLPSPYGSGTSIRRAQRRDERKDIGLTPLSRRRGAMRRAYCTLRLSGNTAVAADVLRRVTPSGTARNQKSRCSFSRMQRWQADPAAAGQINNWMPAPKSDDFSLCLRTNGPRQVFTPEGPLP